MNVRCPVCGSNVKLAVGDTQLACTACGLAAPLSHIGTAPGVPPSAHVALETDLTGTLLAGRTLVERIGAGGMGTVYRARGSDGADVAIKVLRPGLGIERAALLARFAREAEALRRLDHPRVVRFLDHGEAGDVAYIVTELVDGKDLAARLADGRLSLAEVVDVFGQVCDGVAAAHAAGIVHRDLKPANILVGTKGVEVADFGLASLGADAAVTTLTRTNVAMGTYHYLAPEQRKDARAVDHRADVWALGVILYEMLTGELPLGSYARASTLGPPGCDRRIDAIVDRALAPDPAQRYASAAELARDVRKLIAPRRRERLVIAVAAALALTGGTVVAVAMTSSDGPPRAALPAPSAAVSPALATPPDAAVVAVTADADVDASVDAALVAALPDAADPIDVAKLGKVVKRPPQPGRSKPGPKVGVSKPPPKAGAGSDGKVFRPTGKRKGKSEDK